MRTLIKGGNVIDPDNIEGKYDILIEGEKIVGIESNIELGEKDTDIQTIDAFGKIVVPGLVDMHVHFRDPGEEYKEDIESGSRAAAAGGFTAVCPMPNTKPVNDSGIITEYMVNKAKKLGLVKVHPVGAISKGLKGEQLSEFSDMKRAGAVAVSDDGNPVVSSLLMRRALEYGDTFGLRVISHCEDKSLAGTGVMNESPLSTQMGLSGIPNAAESIMVTRDILLSELTDIPVHIAHVSAKESVNAIRDAKKRGVKVTCETTPHYFSLTHDAVSGYNTHAKMNPPLRSEEDRLAIIEGLKDGTIDAIATDHAPHSSIEKDVEFDWAANGILGLETSLPLSLKLVEDKHLTLSDLIRKMSAAPSKILGLDHGLHVGKAADITIIDLDKVFTVNADTLLSKSRNTPFNEWQMKGKAIYTIVNGNISYKDSELIST